MASSTTEETSEVDYALTLALSELSLDYLKRPEAVGALRKAVRIIRDLEKRERKRERNEAKQTERSRNVAINKEVSTKELEAQRGAEQMVLDLIRLVEENQNQRVDFKATTTLLEWLKELVDEHQLDRASGEVSFKTDPKTLINEMKSVLSEHPELSAKLDTLSKETQWLLFRTFVAELKYNLKEEQVVKVVEQAANDAFELELRRQNANDDSFLEMDNKRLRERVGSLEAELKHQHSRQAVEYHAPMSSNSKSSPVFETTLANENDY
ncbi:MAG: hypothetical protein M1812_005445 [Candelaria pacifica]|nr:MAG: hypothetical protein M1812_005445 [Candelaria pacifica]